MGQRELELEYNVRVLVVCGSATGSVYKYGFKLLYEITVVRVPVKVRKTQSLKLRQTGRAAAVEVRKTRHH